MARGAVYGENLTKFIAAIRAELMVELPFVMGLMPPESEISPELATKYPGFLNVRQGQLEVAANVPRVATISPRGISRLDGVHYDAMGQIEYGQYFANGYLGLISGESDVRGDFDENGQLDANDIDGLTAAIKLQDLRFDITDDGIVDQADRRMWVTESRGTWYGDSNLDGEFNSGDLVRVFTVGKYETGQAAGWADGDWDGDGVFGTGDLVRAFDDGGFEQGTRGAVAANAAVPEPSTSLLFACAASLTKLSARRRRL